MVSYPSISGIMMSIRTIATSGVDSSIAIASRPVPAVRTRHAPPLQHAAECENIPNVVVHHQHFLPHQRIVRAVQTVEHPLFLRRKVGDYTMQKQCSLIQQPFRRLHSFDHHAARQRCSRASSSGDSSFPVNTTTGKSFRFWRFAQALQDFEARHIGQAQVQHDAVERLLFDRGERFGAGGGDRNINVVMTQQFANTELLRRVVFHNQQVVCGAASNIP